MVEDIITVLFFVSVGLLFNVLALVSHPLLFLALKAVILVFATRTSVRTALTVAGGLAQNGEFSFILATEARQLNPWMVSLWLKLERPLPG